MSLSCLKTWYMMSCISAGSAECILNRDSLYFKRLTMKELCLSHEGYLTSRVECYALLLLVYFLSHTMKWINEDKKKS